MSWGAEIMSLSMLKRRKLVAAVAAAAVVVGLIAVAGSASAGATRAAAAGPLSGFLGAGPGLDDIDARPGSTAPTAAQLSVVNSLGATARWNRFGTPQSLIRHGGWLATGLSADPVTAARSWLSSRASLFRLTPASVAALEVLNDSKLAGAAGDAVLFRQRFGTLPSAQDGLISVAVKGGKVAYVSSSSAGNQAAPAAAALSPTQAWLKAAANVGRLTPAAALSVPKVDPRTGWTVFTATGFAQIQRARLVAVPMPTGGVKPAYETIVLDSQGGGALAYTVFVDAVSGNVLMRYNRTDQTNQAEGFQGSYTPAACGQLHNYSVDANTKSIDVVASAAVITNDIILRLIHNGVIKASSDTATSPEVIHYAPAVIAPGVYSVQICPFNPPIVPPIAPYTYVGAFVSNDAPTATFPYPPQWKYFPNSPPLYASTDNRLVGCWVTSVGGTTVPGCQRKEQNLASRAPWDHNVQANAPTLTTLGNNASTAEAWTSPLTPGPAGQRPVAPDRKYIYPWTNQWNTSKCAPTVFASPQRNDIDASVTDLFVGHNRFHDFSYFLGFTEDNYNAQTNNFGNTAPGPYPAGREGDPEVGNVQAGALDGGYPTFEGRDNANQITLNDGIPPITNQYLFQPIAATFYAPCADGDYDATIFGHEYTHLISNRMVGGPDGGIDGHQGQSMGESWSDLVALEYLHEFGYTPVDGESPWAVGAYATGNKAKGIRDYALNANPLTYGDMGFDTTGPEVHADGEIWNAVNYDIRQALVAKYNGAFPASNKPLQVRCAQGELPASSCPGNRRWLQLVFDAFLLQSSGTSMLDGRDTLLAADMMRFGGANQATLWKAFAKRGFGKDAATAGTDDTSPTPNYVAKVGSQASTVSFTAQANDKPGMPKVAGAKIYVGNYEARVRPIATTNASGVATFKMEPGTYPITAQANGHGIWRFNITVPANSTFNRVIHYTTNLASKFNGATATGGPTGADFANLIDDTQATDWTDEGPAPVNVTKPSVTVHLAGAGTAAAPTPKMVRSVKVSALLNPGQNRFTALRQFALQTCTESISNPGCAIPAGFTTIYTSPANAFPGVAPRPVAPDLLLRTFDVPDTAATHLRLVALNSQCTGGPAYRGEQDNDPANMTDCVTGSAFNEAAFPLLFTARGNTVRAAELEAYSFDTSTRPPGDPVVALTMTAPATASSGSNMTTAISYTNLGPKPSANAVITDKLPAGLSFVSATNGGTYNAATRTVTWKLGTVPVTFTGTVRVTTRVTAPVATVILNQANFTGDETLGLPGAATTLVVP